MLESIPCVVAVALLHDLFTNIDAAVTYMDNTPNLALYIELTYLQNCFNELTDVLNEQSRHAN